ncbi:uncharacterized protein A4U43_C02F15240 [Asparagus officinalis]|uniref:Uncharacterized protein n=1 Tax=Asparagus officinalis TaxID=4686 RepID=A0A5P1FNG8_ASPOF|nr:uncharacterized protein A4U43_C02F15240 [Asparagus officinalis]
MSSDRGGGGSTFDEGALGKEGGEGVEVAVSSGRRETPEGSEFERLELQRVLGVVAYKMADGGLGLESGSSDLRKEEELRLGCGDEEECCAPRVSWRGRRGRSSMRGPVDDDESRAKRETEMEY